ncbi:hypothetical protein [Celeribacter naphthalenivorans]|uniref:hypothetical protein n=1 Tax=Celeribacter naphthalenivorans TaxID=1614694 RepID=UPI001CFA12DA|nr:hypothetical protein [Celeribacter naphthalenivorans]
MTETENDAQAFDWSKASNAERKKLFSVTKAIASATGTALEVLLNTALGQPSDHDWGDMANLRNGKLAREKSQKLYDYLAEHHYELAQKTNETLFPFRVVRDVEAYITEAAHQGRLHVVPTTDELGLVKRKRQHLPPDAVLELGESFCLELDAINPGFAVAFQGYKGEWHPLPLGADGEEQACRIKEGMQLLPQTAEGQPESLSEDEDTG